MSATASTTKSQSQTKTDTIHSIDYSNVGSEAVNTATNNKAGHSFVRYGANYVFSSASADGSPSPMGSPVQFDIYGQPTDVGAPTSTTTPSSCNACSGPFLDDPASLTWSSPVPSAPVAANIVIPCMQGVKLTYVKSIGGFNIIPPSSAPNQVDEPYNVLVSAPVTYVDEVSSRTVISTASCSCNNNEATCADFGEYDTGSAWTNATSTCGINGYSVFATSHAYGSKASNGNTVTVGVLSCENYNCCATCADFGAYDVQSTAQSDCLAAGGNGATSCTFSANMVAQNLNVSCASLSCWCCY
jgi:hypothetical protein